MACGKGRSRDNTVCGAKAPTTPRVIGTPCPRQKNLDEFAYGGNNGRMKPDVENLVRQGLIEFKSIPHEETGSRQLLALTKNGHRFLTHTQNDGSGQALYHDFTKPRKAHHDADLYR